MFDLEKHIAVCRVASKGLVLGPEGQKVMSELEAVLVLIRDGKLGIGTNPQECFMCHYWIAFLEDRREEDA